MGLLDVLRGRSKETRPNLDALFGLPGAAVTLSTSLDLRPTGLGAVCFRAAEGAAFAEVQREVVALLDADDGPPVEVSADEFGFTWLLVRQPDLDVSALVTDLHAVNTTLQTQGFASNLLCSTMTFRSPPEAGSPHARTLGLVYLYKQGTFYPFAPTGPSKRDNLLEIQVRDLLAGELPVERELSRWMALWGAPGF